MSASLVSAGSQHVGQAFYYSRDPEWLYMSVDLGSGAPGTTISGALGPVTLTDDRALLSASWTVEASASDFTTGGGTPAETIPAIDVSYDPGSITTTGTITATGTPVTLSGTAQPVVTAQFDHHHRRMLRQH